MKSSYTKCTYIQEPATTSNILRNLVLLSNFGLPLSTTATADNDHNNNDENDDGDDDDDNDEDGPVRGVGLLVEGGAGHHLPLLH